MCLAGAGMPCYCLPRKDASRFIMGLADRDYQRVPSHQAYGGMPRQPSRFDGCPVVKWLLIVALVASVGLLIFYRPAAYLAAIPIPVLYCLLVVLNLMERRSRATQLRRPGQTAIGQEEIEELYNEGKDF